MTIRTVTLSSMAVVVEPGVQQWAHPDQPFKKYGIHMQTRRAAYGENSFDVRAEAVMLVSGELVASTSHSRCTYDDVRTWLAQQQIAA